MLTAHSAAPCSWRKPGKLRPPYDVDLFPHMTAKQGAQRGRSEACPPLLPRNCRASATSAARTSRSATWRHALLAKPRCFGVGRRRYAFVPSRFCQRQLRSRVVREGDRAAEVLASDPDEWSAGAVAGASSRRTQDRPGRDASPDTAVRPAPHPVVTRPLITAEAGISAGMLGYASVRNWTSPRKT